MPTPAAPSPAVAAPPKADLFGVGVSVAGPDTVRDTIVAWAEARRSAAVDFMAVHSLVTAAREPGFRELLGGFDIVACDGQPVRWALNRFHGAALPERCYGPHLMLRVCEQAAARGIGVYLYGGKHDVLDRLTDALLDHFPALRIVGAEMPPSVPAEATGRDAKGPGSEAVIFRPLTDDEHDALAARINASGAGVVLLGLGCPRQEAFAARHLGSIYAVMMCVGAAFDFHAGQVPMAPPWMQSRGLEWLYRLGREPRRLWKRYFVTNSLFLGLATRRVLLGR